MEKSILNVGVQGFDKKNWATTRANHPDEALSLRLAYRSPNGGEGYPGTVTITVTYTVTTDNSFLIKSEATTDRPTPFGLTHSSYFNLAGEASGPITDHELQIYADGSIITDKHMTLLGQCETYRLMRPHGLRG